MRAAKKKLPLYVGQFGIGGMLFGTTRWRRTIVYLLTRHLICFQIIKLCPLLSRSELGNLAFGNLPLKVCVVSTLMGVFL